MSDARYYAEQASRWLVRALIGALLAGWVVLTVATLLVALSSPAHAQACDWSNPGANRYTGTVEQAIARHERAGLVSAEEAKLIRAERAAGRRIVLTITRDAITGPGGPYLPDLHGMHFGAGRMCTTPADRSAWPVDRRMASVSYCAGMACVTCPAACTNCSVVYRARPRPSPPPMPPDPARRAPLLIPDPDPVPGTPSGGGLTFPAWPAVRQLPNVAPLSSLSAGQPRAADNSADARDLPPIPMPPIGPAPPLLPPEPIPAPIPGVPEPAPWAYLLAGIAVLAALRYVRTTCT